ncbi:hypothetical protein GCM10010393_33360 [Streptomyces gobitricini]|uniref:Uncharacterized protein n=1 Tax=Streptomyces gobitricini TaxID=68211 RepID=A0ABP5ZJ19_9ACTN
MLAQPPYVGRKRRTPALLRALCALRAGGDDESGSDVPQAPVPIGRVHHFPPCSAFTPSLKELTTPLARGARATLHR